MEGRFRLLRVTDGISHFARVVVRGPRNGEAQPSETVPPAWLAAARMGVDDAMEAVGRDREGWSVSSFEGTLVDTRDEDAWAAAVMAVFDALNVPATLSYDRTWVVTLPDGQQLLATDRGSLQRPVHSELGDEPLATYEAVRERMRALETLVTTDEDAALTAMAELYPIASRLLAHDVCDAIELWLHDRGRDDLRAGLRKRREGSR